MKRTGQRNPWTLRSRMGVFLLASSSIGCLLGEFYGVCPMRLSVPFVCLPALVALAAAAWFDGRRGVGCVHRAVWIGVVAGLLAAVGYDLFRLPFVFARQWSIDSVIPPMALFKTFPRFGAMLLGQEVEQATYSWSAQLLGWGYHFSNGATFGIMYYALIGNPPRRHWAWGILFAVVLELGMLFTPYARAFAIPVTRQFMAVTLAAHGLFGLILGVSVQAFASQTEKTKGLRAVYAPAE